MSKQLLREFHALCPDGMCLDLLSETEKREVREEGVLYLTGRIQTADKKNGNGRKYPMKVMRREMDNYIKIVNDNRACGELDHPDDSVINLKNVSHMVTKCWWEGKDVMGKIKVLDTPSGRILKDLINAGVKLGISSRGLGSVKESMGELLLKTTSSLFALILYQSHRLPMPMCIPGKDRRKHLSSRQDCENKKKITLTIYLRRFLETK